MATTSPDNIWTPDAGDDYALTTDLAATADTIQDALTSRPRTYRTDLTNAQRLALTGADLFEGLRVRTSDTKVDWLYTGSTWTVPNAALEATAAPALPNNASTAITGWTIDAARSLNPADAATISGSTITIKPGRYAVTVLVALNSSGSIRPVTGRSLVEVSSGETATTPLPRSNPAIGEDTWSLSYNRSYTSATALTVNVLASTAVGAVGTNIRLMINRIA